ncbi:hypothetical protein COT86_04340 [Candidatus Collierbacteria bacterium CG10_big_fil_rev_8_21_14_0_10_43_36]|uniref:AB hydrolase-1 domain-containing protein n=1 Tax=Candidatus Collierbacteria bacterium CG10_big_fil_rev_8_21_14_0_10_43_36 TaxID=1974534 RepID=A0A2H0VJX7_9BACT|nr:MAG: hypothetical protein COT86_04340 [Candidatus Collierbacteria bacterium CG10_big_fil_rev_8_21_14_0_10_43_36]
MRQKHFVIFVPGLGDDSRGLEFLSNHWLKHGFTPKIISFGWLDGKKFQPKLEGLLTLIDTLSQQGCLVSLVGTSAGGSAVLNAFLKRKNQIHRVINICGRLRTGPITGLRSFSSKTSTSPAFAESIKLFENREHLLSRTDRKKIMTMRPAFGDELVPPNTVSIAGSSNITLPTVEHILSIALSLSLFSKVLLRFLNSGNPLPSPTSHLQGPSL